MVLVAWFGQRKKKSGLQFMEEHMQDTFDCAPSLPFQQSAKQQPASASPFVLWFFLFSFPVLFG